MTAPSVPPVPVPRPSITPAPALSPLPKSLLSPVAPRSPEASRTAPPAPPSEDDFEEIRRLGGLLGIVRERGESSAEYARRVEREVAASPRPAAPPKPPEVSVPPPPAKPVTPSGSTPDIDELMSWLEKMAAEKEVPPAPTTSAKRVPPTGGASDSTGSSSG
ncbi:MAG: hypothetical protein WAK40_01055 [Thermoplasmata archaeon]